MIHVFNLSVFYKSKYLVIDLLIQIMLLSCALVHQTSTWGATARVVRVAMAVNREKRMRQMRSRTIAANFQSA